MTVAGIVLQNLVYVIGAALGILVGAVAVTLRQRKPKTIEANMASFHRGLQALAPGVEPGRRQPSPPGGPPPRPHRAYSVIPAPAASGDPCSTVTEADAG